ncbi:MAG: type II secretion system protein [bacterium]|nr:type II secretion system protein [bacterium]
MMKLLRLKNLFARFHRQRTRNHGGFGLMEMVVVTAIFGISMTVIVMILTNSLRFQRQVRAEQQVVSAARDALEVLAREIRLGEIDYQAFLDAGEDLDVIQVDSAPGPLDHVYITASSGDSLLFELVDQQLVSGTQPLSSTDINITNLRFYIDPTSDPYHLESCVDDSNCDPQSIPVKDTDPGLGIAGSCTAAGICEIENVQTRVTIILRAETRDAGPSRFASVDLQTTVSVRNYSR